jgi:putative ATP-dependent endonuclease of the OLD family
MTPDLTSLSLKFQGYKCFLKENPPQGVDQIAKINIIVGRNNSGKSTLLECIRSWSKGAQRLPIASTTIELQFAESVFDRRFSKQEYVRFSHNGIDRSFDLRPQSRRLRGNKLRFEYDTDFRLDRIVGEKGNARESDPDLWFTGQNLCGLVGPAIINFMQHWVAISSERNIVPELSKPECIEVSPDGTGLTACIERRLHSGQSNRIDLIEGEFIPAMNRILLPDNEYTRILALQSEAEAWELYLEEKSKGRIPLNSTGSGIKTVLQVLANLLIVPKMQGMDLGATVFAFEELENNLHPATLRRLFRFLKDFADQNGCTFFITTHSPIVIDMFSGDASAQIIHVKHDGRAATVESFSGIQSGHNLLEDLGVLASDLLQTNAVIWVEGPSDAIYFQRWMDLHSNGTIRRGVDYQCVFYGGSTGLHMTFDVDSADKLIQAAKICRNSIVILDSNKASTRSKLDENTNRILKEVKESGGIGWVTDGREIENYLPPTVIEEATNLPSSIVERFTDIFDAIKRRRKSTHEIKKVHLANRIAPHLTVENMYQLDLRKRLEVSAAKIREWNRHRHG